MKKTKLDPLLQNDFSFTKADLAGELANNKVIVYLWPFKNMHASIEIFHQGRHIYISVYPVQPHDFTIKNYFKKIWCALKTLCRAPARLEAVDETEQNPPPFSYTLYGKINSPYEIRHAISGFDIKTMWEKAREYKQIIWAQNHQPDLETGEFEEEVLNVNSEPKLDLSNFKYGLCSAKASVCSGIVMELLEVGGLMEFMPSYVKFYDPRHIFYLLLRPTSALAFASPIFYFGLTHGTKKHWENKLILLGGYSLQIFSVFILDKFLIPSGKLCLLNKHYARTRRIIEPFGIDALIHLISLLGFGYTSLLFVKAQDRDSLDTLDVNFLTWLVFSLGGMISSGLVSSFFLSLALGVKVIVRPDGIKRVINYLTTVRELKPNFIRYYFIREVTLLLIPLSAVTGFSLITSLTHDKSNGVIYGSGGGAVVGYIFTKFMHKFSQTKKINVQLKQLKENNLELFTLYQSHDARPEQFVLESVGAVAGMMGAMLWVQADMNDDVYLSASASIIGSALGYLMGTSVYQASRVITAEWNSLFCRRTLKEETPRGYCTTP